MRGTQEQDRIEELAQLLDGELSHDQAGAHVRSLVQLATTLRDEIELERPDPAFKAALRAQVIEAAAASQLPLLARARDAFWERTARIRHSAKVATATATASMMLGTAGVAAAAQTALPGDALYGIKEATESLRFAFASGNVEVGRLHLAMAEERLDEVTSGIDRLAPGQVIATLERMDASSQAGAEELLAAFAADPSLHLLEELQAFSTRQRTLLTGVVDRLPLEAKPFAENSLELLRRIDVAVGSSAAACDCGDLAASIAGRSTVTAVGSGPAASGACDCTGAELPVATAREGRGGESGSDGSVGSGVGSTLSGSLPGGSTGSGTATGGSGTGGSGTSQGGLRIPSELDTSGIPGVPSTGGTGGGTGSTPVDGGSGSVTDPVEEATEVVDDVVETVTETASEIGGTVGGTLP